ncbi:AAA family ATPase [Algiphilus sp. NNCM1]|uniref:AAA family ATPase n=1 Tax=Algiphilus sp. TaxID=1872431 RepID=UPI001CA75E6E|nr:AAA family ATPase [Algiphilus sp.]MBY8964497.1 AAA family ATPase [Algiphilus acroporae]MCI5062346.1 AAA family ATPase [Algiphilus sp.]MCI5103180.1 AAA family ATPase [Algiphilus sp.]MCK5770653.1 AAA family ATPase [Algiphilus sp.]
MITVIAGVNGAGKSSIIGAYIRQAGGDYCNPDEITRQLMAGDPGIGEEAANGEAWRIGFRQLQRAIAQDDDYTFETTLGGNSIRDALLDAAEKGRSVRVLSMGLASVETHLERIAARAAKGGHAIPADKVRQRWETSRHNLTQLMPHCHEVRVLDNTAPMHEGVPKPRILLHLRGRCLLVNRGESTPEWAQHLMTEATRCAE